MVGSSQKKKLKEYAYVEKYFDTDDDGDLIYDKDSDTSFILDNMKMKKEYTGFKSFMKWIGNKNREELEQEKEEEKPKKKDNKELTPSDEQNSILKCISHEKNVSVDAVAGSGKTTIVLFVAKKNKGKRILQITYNKQLKNEVRKKVTEMGINNLEIHTYHSLAVKYYDSKAHTDDKIIKILADNVAPKTKNGYDIIIVDEVQDMTVNYYSLVNKFIFDMKARNAILMTLGDKYQGIYDFKNADTRFLTLSNQLWTNTMKNKVFISLPLQESYRVTKQIAWFVNNVMIGQKRIVSNKDSTNNVKYYRRNKFTIAKTFSDLIMKYLKNGYTPSDIFVLSPSIKSTSNNPVKKLENALVNNNIPVHFARNDEDGIDENVVKGKIAFTTFHQAKGRERKIVFVFGFDATYFKYFCKEKDPTVCPSELYVAVTRASEILVILEDEQSEQLPFMKYKYKELFQSKMVDFIGSFDYKKKNTKFQDKKKDTEEKEKDNDDFHETSVTELTKYIDEENMNNITQLITQLFKKKNEISEKNTVDIPSSITTKNGLTEDVSDLNGLVIPAIYEKKSLKVELSTLELSVREMYGRANKSSKKYIDSKFNDLEESDKDLISYYLRMGNLYIALSEEIFSKLNQIEDYDWLTKKMVKKCRKNLECNIGIGAKYEKTLGQKTDEKGKYFQYTTNTYGTINIRGRVDCYDDETLWEFKCVNSLQMEHMLQLTVYAWIWKKSMETTFGEKLFKLLNIRTCEIYELKYKSHIVDEIMDILFANKYTKKVKENDKLFIKKCKTICKGLKNKKLDVSQLEEPCISEDEDNCGCGVSNMFSKK